MKILNLTLSILTPLIFIQTRGQVPIGLRDQSNQLPLAFSTIELKYKNGAVKYLISDSAGFTIRDTIALFQIRISKIGYETRIISQDQLYPLPSILYLKMEVKTLENIELRANKPLLTSNAQKMVYDVFRDTTLADRNAAEAIGRLPFISVDALNNISYKDKRKFLVLVNGNRFGLLSEDPNIVLKTIPASRIKSVELIFDPPLEMRMKGYDAVVNIITKPGYYKGWLGSMTAVASTINNHNGNAYLNYQYNESFFQILYDGRFESQPGSMEQEVIDFESGTVLNQTNRFRSKSRMNRYGFTFDQRLRSNLRLGLYASYNRSPNSEDGLGLIREEKNGSLKTVSQFSEYSSLRAQWELGADMGYQYGKKNNLGLQFKTQWERQESAISREAPAGRQESIRQKPREVSGQVSNTLNLKGGFRLENVGKFIARDFNNVYFDDTLVNSVWVPVGDNQADQFRFRIFNLNNQLAYNRENLSARIGFNFDYADYSGQSVNNRSGYQKLYLLPSVGFRYAFKNESLLDFGYYLRVFRPSILHLSSRIPNYDPLIRRSGNPELEATRVQNLYTEYSLYSKSGNNYFFIRADIGFSNDYLNAFFQFDSASSTQVRTLRQSNYFQSRLRLGGEIEMNSKWSVDFSTEISYMRVAESESRRPLFFIDASSVYRFSKTSGIQLSGSFESRTITGYGSIRNYGNYDLNYYLFLAKRKLQINLIASNLFHKNQVRREYIEGMDYYANLNMVRPYREIQLSVVLRFGQLKTFRLNTRKLNHGDVMGGE